MASLRGLNWRNSSLFSPRFGVLWKTYRSYMSSKVAMERTVVHDKKQQEFYIDLAEAGGERAYLQYEEPRPGVLDLVHTVVPEALRGQGIAKLLAKEAFDFTIQSDRRMILTCTYLQKYYNDNPLPEYTERVLDS